MFDLAAVNRAIDFFAEILCLNGGEWEGRPFILLPWQAFIVGSLFGWKTDDGYRRFRVAYIEAGKGSGKSPLVAGIGLYGLVADNEPRAEIYSAATKKDQAMILFRDAVAMVRQSPELKKRLIVNGVGEKAWNISYLKAGSFFRPISSDDGQSGPRPHIALLDEIHEHKDARVIEIMRAGTKGRRQALICMITNSGVGKNTVCWSYHEYGAKIAAQQLQDDSFFSYICALDEGDEPFTDPSCWLKANPSLGVTIPAKYLDEQVREAKGMPAKESVVRRLNFCQWVEAHNPWIASDTWFACADEFASEDLLGRACYGGLDLGSTQDLTALVLVFPPQEAEDAWRVLPFFWLPDGKISERADKDRVPYLAWRDDGLLLTTPGNAVNRLDVIRQMTEITQHYEVRDIAYDRWRIEDLRVLMEQEGVSFPMSPFGQGFKDMSPAIDETERLILQQKLLHNNHPILTWNAANAVLVTDPAGNRKLDKKSASGRVDGIVALVMAIGRAIVDQGGQVVDVNEWFL